MTRGEFGGVRKTSRNGYQARYYYRGKSYVRTFPTKGRAQGWLAAEHKLIEFDEWTPPNERAAEAEKQAEAKALTVGVWLTRYHEGLAVRASTAQTYLRTITNRILTPVAPGDTAEDITRLKDIPLIELTRQDVYRWWDAIEQAYTTKETNRKAYTRLRAACTEAVRRELIPLNPIDIRASARTYHKEPPYLPADDELHKIVAAIDDRYKLLTILTLFHGLRIGEAIALEAGDIIRGSAGDWIRVRQNAQRISPSKRPELASRLGKERTFMLIQPPKSAAGRREVRFMPQFTPILDHHLTTYAGTTVDLCLSDELGGGTRPARLLTATAKGGIVMDTSYRSVLARAIQRAGVSERIRPHSGRRWLTTRLAEQGAHLREISEILGDEDVDTIMSIYMQVNPGRTTELMDMVSNSVTVTGSEAERG